MHAKTIKCMTIFSLSQIFGPFSFALSYYFSVFSYSYLSPLTFDFVSDNFPTHVTFVDMTTSDHFSFSVRQAESQHVRYMTLSFLSVFWLPLTYISRNFSLSRYFPLSSAITTVRLFCFRTSAQSIVLCWKTYVVLQSYLGLPYIQCIFSSSCHYTFNTFPYRVVLCD